jgi:hypothetical protein
MEVYYEPQDGQVIDARETMYPTYAKFIMGPSANVGGEYATTYGYVLEGRDILATANGQDWRIQEGNFFAFHGIVDFGHLKGGQYKIWTVTKLGYRCLPMVGQIETNGRLSYIDGCSDSVLVSMPRYGDPVLNYLHFPTGIYQTQHTHPSIRMGVVIGGEGEAFQEKSNHSDGWIKPLKKGCMFLLTEQELHSFRTSDSYMDIIAFHPDSDTGPTDENHSMINRTYIDHGK